MKTLNQVDVFILAIQCLQIVTAKPVFKGLSFKKNYEVEISAIPFKHISFIKEKWFPFKMIGVKHDIVKREVDPQRDVYSVNEVTFDNEESGHFPGLLTSVKHNLDLNSEGEKINEPAPVVENVEAIPVFESKNIASSSIQTSSVIPVSPSIIIAPSIHTAGSVVQPSAVVPSSPKATANSVSTETVVEPSPPAEKTETSLIQPMHTHVDVSAIEKPEEAVSKLHTDISSVVPLNTLVAAPAQEMDISLPEVKVETPVAEVPRVVEEIKEEPKVEPPPVVEPPAVIPVTERPIATTIGESLIPILPGKTGPPGILMRGTRFVLYFGSVMLQLLSQMLSGTPPALNQIAEPIALR